MTRETKAGLLMIVMLGSVFGFMVYKRMHQPAAALAQQNPPSLPQENPDEAPVTEAESKDPFLTESSSVVETSAVVPVAAKAPGRIPDDDPATRASAGLQNDTENSRETEADPFAEQRASRPAPTPKPKLPTAVADDTFNRVAMDGVKAATTTDVKPIPDRPAVEPAATAQAPARDDFDPFQTSERSQIRPPTTIQITDSAVERPAEPTAARRGVVEDSEPSFGPPANVGSRQPQPNNSIDVTEVNDPFATALDRESTAFEAPVVAKPQVDLNAAAPPDSTASDPFATDNSLEVQRPAKSAAARVAAEIELGFDAPGEPTATTRREPNVDASFDQTPTPTNAPPVLKTPPRDNARSDDRFGGFRPANQTESPSSAFPDERPAVPSFSGEGSPRRTARPAPVTQIDEDFGAKPSARPLVAGNTYIIEPNENYWTISRKKYGTGRYFMALAQHNAQVITDPKRMRPGVTIATPSAEALERAYPQLIPKPASIDPAQTASVSTSAHAAPSAKVAVPAEPEAEAGFFVSNDGVPMYRIGQEDTLSGIAQRHLGRSSRWVQVLELNRHVLTDGNTLKIGTILRLPADASRVDVVGAVRTFR